MNVDHDSVLQMDILLKTYKDWQHNDDVKAVIVKGAGGKVLHYH